MLLCLFTLLSISTVPAAASPADDEVFSVDARAALLIDLNSDNVLYELNADEELYPASLTKIMTAILAIENGNLDDVITASQTALTGLDPDGTTVWLSAGEQMPLRDLLYCMLLASANDACNVVAEYISGSIEDFVALMNKKAKELGCTGTHFSNTNGLPDDTHTTTARDLAIITKYAIQNPTFWEICTTVQYTVPATNVFDPRVLVTTNSMMSTHKYYYFYDSRVQGVKTGYTAAAGRCLIVTAQEDDMRLLSVVLGAPDTMLYNNVSWYGHYADTAMMLEYGFGVLDGTIVPAKTDVATEEAAPVPADDPMNVPPTIDEQQPSEDETSAISTDSQSSDAGQTHSTDQSSTGLISLSTDADTVKSSEKKSFPWLLLILIILAVLLEACIVYILCYRFEYRRRRQRQAAARLEAARTASRSERDMSIEDEKDSN